MLETLVLAFVAFASTNIDGAFILLALFSDPTLNERDVVIGQYLGMAALTGAAVAFAALARAVPDRELGWMGLLPIVIGAHRAWTAWRGRDADTDLAPARARSPGGVLAVTSISLANGSDNIAVYVPLFDRSPLPQTLLICVMFAALLAAWCAGARWLVGQGQLGAAARRWAGRATPVALIALGTYVLLRSGALSRPVGSPWDGALRAFFWR